MILILDNKEHRIKGKNGLLSTAVSMPNNDNENLFFLSYIFFVKNSFL